MYVPGGSVKVCEYGVFRLPEFSTPAGVVEVTLWVEAPESQVHVTVSPCWTVTELGLK